MKDKIKPFRTKKEILLQFGNDGKPISPEVGMAISLGLLLEVLIDIRDILKEDFESFDSVKDISPFGKGDGVSISKNLSEREKYEKVQTNK
jgi:hypothetical protein